MSIFKRVRAWLRGGAWRLRRVQRATRYLMAHVGMTGWCDCVATRDGDGRAGYLLVIHTHQRIPAVCREELRCYFRRKLVQLGELGAVPLLLFIRDADDLARAHRQVAEVSSARIASVMAAANVSAQDAAPPERLAELRLTLRERLARRRQGREDSAYVPAVAAPLTDLGGL